MCAINPNKSNSLICSNYNLIINGIDELKHFFGTRKYIVWHPNEPGKKVIVTRTFWQKTFYPSFFALKSELEQTESIK